jgi:site-specific DNA recombinase
MPRAGVRPPHHFYYLCNGKRHGVDSRRATRCPARYIPAGELDELVWADLGALLREPASLAAAVARAHGGAWLPQELLARRETLRRGQAQLHQQFERLTDAYLGAVIPLDEYERRRRDLEQRVQALAGQEQQLRSEAERRQLVLLLIDRMVVTDADVEIRYALPTSPESEHVRFCQLRKDYFRAPSGCCSPLRPPPLGASAPTPATGPSASGRARPGRAPPDSAPSPPLRRGDRRAPR